MKELIEVLDENGHKTGIIKTKSEIKRNGDYHRAIRVIIVNSANEVLFQKRSNKKKMFPNLWSIYLTGHVKAYEESTDAIIREVKEEIGIDILSDELEYLYTIKDEKKKNNYDERIFFDTYLLRKDIDINEIKMNNEVIGVQYLTIDEINYLIENNSKMIIPNDYDVILDVLKEKKNVKIKVFSKTQIYGIIIMNDEKLNKRIKGVFMNKEFIVKCENLLNSDNEEIKNNERFYNLKEICTKEYVNKKLIVPIGKIDENENVFMDFSDSSLIGDATSDVRTYFSNAESKPSVPAVTNTPDSAIWKLAAEKKWLDENWVYIDYDGSKKYMTNSGLVTETANDNLKGLGGYYYYKIPVAPDESTSPLISWVMTYFKDAQKIKIYDILVYTETIQTIGIDGTEYTATNWTDAWKAYLHI